MPAHTRRVVTQALLLSTVMPAVTQAAMPPIRIGAILSLTGPYASLGLPQRNTLALLPASIAGHPIDVQVVDDAGDPAMAANAARQMMDRDAIDILFGTTVTPTTLPVIPTAGATGTPVVSFAASSAVIEPQDGAKRWIFKPAPADRLTTDPLVAHMAANSIGSVSVIAFSTAYGDGLIAAVAAGAAARRIRIVSTERFAPTAADAKAEARRTMAADPEAVFVAASGVAGVLPMVALRQAGFRGFIYTTGGIANPDALRAGGTALDGVLLTLSPVLLPEQLDDGDPVKAAATRYIDAYEGRFGAGSRSLFGATTWDGFALLQRCTPGALAVAEPGTPAFRAALRDGLERVRGLVGAEGVFDLSPADHSGSGPSSQVMARITDGQWRLLGA